MGAMVKTPFRIEVHPVDGSVTLTSATEGRNRSPFGSGAGAGGSPFSSQVSVSIAEFGIGGELTEIDPLVEERRFPVKGVPLTMNSTIIGFPKFTPVIVTKVPPLCGPPNGEMLKMAGRGIL